MRRDAWVALALGIVLAAASLVAFALSGSLRAPLLVLFGTELAAGREAAIPAGIAVGLPWPTAALATTAIEWSMLLLGFPLLVLAGEGLRRSPAVAGLFARAEAFAAARPTAGVLALGALTLAPFVPVGALTSVLVGEILRLPSRRLLPVLAAAELLANVSFAYAAAAVLSFLPSPRLVAGIAAGLLLVGAAASALLARRRQNAM